MTYTKIKFEIKRKPPPPALEPEAVTMLARWEMQEDRAKAGQEYRFTAND